MSTTRTRKEISVESLAVIVRSAMYAALDHAAVMARTAHALRQGEEIALFADGEAGILAAEQMAEDHRRTARKAEAILDLLEEAASVTITLDPKWWE